MNLRQKMIQSAALVMGVVGMSIVASVPGTSVMTSGEDVSLQYMEVPTGRTAGVVLAMDNLEEESLEAFTMIGA